MNGEFLTWQNELEVVFSVMTDKELMEMKDRVEVMIKEEAYTTPNFPVSYGGLRWIVATILFSFWVRKGKGVKLVEGEVVVCPLEESPFWVRYQRPASLEEEGEEERVYDPDNPDHERDQTDINGGEWV